MMAGPAEVGAARGGVGGQQGRQAARAGGSGGGGLPGRSAHPLLNAQSHPRHCGKERRRKEGPPTPRQTTASPHPAACSPWAAHTTRARRLARGRRLVGAARAAGALAAAQSGAMVAVLQIGGSAGPLAATDRCRELLAGMDLEFWPGEQRCLAVTSHAGRGEAFQLAPPAVTTLIIAHSTSRPPTCPKRPPSFSWRRPSAARSGLAAWGPFCPLGRGARTITTM